ncbi:hypothetical protein HBA54_02555 [Pelagibius litoralis]|uniref:S-adenosylmethionine-dependent methyltransferase Rv2258c-like winged HTH domain-containing protein n=1 Tax=Pelagibius litoralis TaxID=374515 RepID=A0A967C203_9PROT|nr:hypothetical protein [Pelagibius litoralis]NIA67463.1 hypothetical protein [Pelagibius litoralis]
MFAAQTFFFTTICDSLRSPQEARASKPRRQGGDAPQTMTDARACLIAALAEMLPSTLEELAQATTLEAPTAQAYLAEMSARCVVMFNPLTKRYSLPKVTPGCALAA